MNTIDILVEGYAKVEGNNWEASSTVALITTSNSHSELVSESNKPHPSPLLKGEGNQGVMHILVDPGANRELLLDRLKGKNLTPDDIEYVFLTHLHLDHSLLMGVFPKAKIINHEAITAGDKGEVVPSIIPGTDITILKTPGHEYAGASLLVPTKNGTVVIAGDLFWWPSSAKATEGQGYDITHTESLINRHDDFASDMSILVQSRKEVLSLADWIVPGHGKVFKVAH